MRPDPLYWNGELPHFGSYPIILLRRVDRPAADVHVAYFADYDRGNTAAPADAVAVVCFAIADTTEARLRAAARWHYLSASRLAWLQQRLARIPQEEHCLCCGAPAVDQGRFCSCHGEQ